MKVELVIDGGGIPMAALSAAANVAEVDLAEPVLEEIPLPLAKPVPVTADKAYDSDPLRERLAEKGFDLISPHRENRQRPATNDGRKLRRYKRRWLIERANAWLHNFRRVVTRWEQHSFIYHGFVQLACALICLGRF
jgi:transposase